MLQLNHPNRAETKPLTIEEQSICVNRINRISRDVLKKDEYTILQELINHYENLQHFYDVAGGWEGLTKLKENSEKVYELTKDKK